MHISLRLLVLAACALFGVALLWAFAPEKQTNAPDGAKAPPGPLPEGPARAFAPTSIWNAALPADAKVDPASRALVAELERQVEEFGPFINSVRFSTPVYTVPAGQPKVRVDLNQDVPDLQRAIEAVPIPQGARPAEGTQRHMVVWQPSKDTMWEFWKAERRQDGWHAEYGGRMSPVSSNPGHFTDPPIWGATATSLPLLGGLIRTDELRRGRIDHALALALPEVRAGVFSLPAQRTDGQVDSPKAIPHGARFRLDPDLDLAELGLPPVTRMIAEAAQRHGIVVRDKSGSVSFYAEQPQAGGDPYPELFGGMSASQLLRRFPWERLEALELELRPG